MNVPETIDRVVVYPSTGMIQEIRDAHWVTTDEPGWDLVVYHKRGIIRIRNLDAYELVYRTENPSD